MSPIYYVSLLPQACGGRKRNRDETQGSTPQMSAPPAYAVTFGQSMKLGWFGSYE
jgi:hypothetical protein